MSRLGAVVAVLLCVSPALAETPTAVRPVNPGQGVVGDLGAMNEMTAELTKEECRGLGGRVTSGTVGNPENCAGKYCVTTDKHGVVRMACIDEKSK